MFKGIGFIDMGIMGQPMARNILNAGHEVMIYNRTHEKTIPLAGEGARTGSTPRQIGEWADVTILMLTGPEAIDTVLGGEDGLLIRYARWPRDNQYEYGPAFLYEKSCPEAQRPSHKFYRRPVSGSRKPAEVQPLLFLQASRMRILRDLSRFS
ncbi:MAG: NAD(P)-binding domain-containing protein [Dissulfurimicrobium sp.]|uniref:NAD(P)-binding domain-containing protein n=1 Tax=Dissulfurimicrobium sp. TaxID=2022436 RepID=UPI00404AAE3C